MKDIRLKKLADVLVNYSTGVKKGDNVCISGEHASLPFIIEIAKAAAKAGGNVRYFVDIPEVDGFLIKNGNEEQLANSNFRFEQCAKADVWISAWGSDNVQSFKNIDAEKLKQKRLSNNENRKIYVNRTATGELRWCGTQFPTNGDAQYAGMSLEEFEDFVYSAGCIDSDDPVAIWTKKAEEQEVWVKYLDTKKELHIISEDTDIKVGINGRKWINCCGKENFPDGEIFTSPEENNINGHIKFSLPAIINGDELEGVTLEVKEGKIIKAQCENPDKQQKLLSYIDTDEGSRYFGEVAIGTNYGIKQFSKNILFDEKIGGTIHMAIGNAMPEAGGKNQSAIHWDIISDMKNGGKIYADGELFYENGKFIEFVLK